MRTGCEPSVCLGRALSKFLPAAGSRAVISTTGRALESTTNLKTCKLVGGSTSWLFTTWQPWPCLPAAGSARAGEQ